MVWFGVLGPLLVRDGNSVVRVPARRQRVLLAALLVRAGEVVSADALAEVMWDEAPPTGAVTTLRSHVMRLRRAMGPGAGARLVTRYPGYLLEAGEEEVDLLQFARLCREGGSTVQAGQWARAWELLTEALGLWRGDALADIPCEVLRRDEMPGLEQRRLQAMEWRMDAGLQLGRHAELVPELRSLTGQYPLRERFAAQLMLALARCGRQAEALAAYHRTREVLVEELGTEPGAGLRHLHQQILTVEDEPTEPEPAASEKAPSVASPPRELPAPATSFAGRAAELASLTRLLDRSAEQAAPAIVISVIGGTAGVGKTALAVYWAHQVAGRFPDGQLYVNLRGYDPDRPMTAADALAGFLRSLGVPGEDTPQEEDERAARYRSLLAGKRVLIVLDNAVSARQVRPLLPGSSSCAVLITSRDSLTGLVARDGAERLDLDMLPLADALALLRALIGGQVDDDPGAAAELAGQCCRLPLALRVAAELAAAPAALPLARLVGELADEQKRLDLLDAGGDPQTAVRAVFSWSYRHLDDATARAFRLLGLHPGRDFEAYSAAALTGAGLQVTRRILDALSRAHLIQPAGPIRYGMHDLLRAYARELAGTHDRTGAQRDALTRLFDHYLHTASAAMDTLIPAERHRRPSVPPPGTPAQPLADAAAARAWLDAERGTLVAMAVYTAEHGWPGHTSRLAATLFRYLDSDGHIPEALIVHSRAYDAARQAGDAAAEAAALNALGIVDQRQGRYRQAADRLEQALALFRQVGDRMGQARALDNLARSYSAQGRYPLAIGLRQEALAVFRRIGDRSGEAHTLANLAAIEEERGRYREAACHQRQSLAIARQIGLENIERAALVNLGTISLRQGRYRQASGYLQEALALSRQSGNRRYAAAALTTIGELCLRQDKPHEATGWQREALALFREIGDRPGEAYALNGLGEALLATGQPGDARAWHRTALGLAHRIGDKYQQARAHNGLARTFQAAGDLGQARRQWRRALALFTELGVPEAGQVRAQLAEAAGDPDRA